MNNINLSTAIKHLPYLIKPHKRIILLSHMRANTSLFGHVLGSHPDIDGYYELHIGYHSWKSFIKQKLIYCHDHTPKRSSKYFFDKVLHDSHKVDTSVFKSSDRLIISLRSPKQTIDSITKLYQKNDPKNKLAQEEYARDYYINRLKQLREYAKENQGHYLYIDADAVRGNTDLFLKGLSQWLVLSTELSKEYGNFALTGKRGAGDSSQNIKSKKIQTITYKKKHTLNEKDETDLLFIKIRQDILNWSINTTTHWNLYIPK